MRVIGKQGNPDLATVYIAESVSGKKIEFVESVEPGIPIKNKWVSILSTMYGCPVKCTICDAGSNFNGKLSSDEILFQLDYLVDNRFSARKVDVAKWKVQFARMGEPSLNREVLKVIEILPTRYIAHGLMPCFSTVAPVGSERFFDKLVDIRHSLYPHDFQFQFSVHTTDMHVRSKLIPVRTWDLKKMAEYGSEFHIPGSRKIGLNFSLIEDVPVDHVVLARYFDPEKFMIKITPLNPTFAVKKNQLRSLFRNREQWVKVVNSLKSAGFDVKVSVGEFEENAIGSNCGQYVSSMDSRVEELKDSYTYEMQNV